MDHQDVFTASRDEVAWYFSAGDAAMGLHGQSIADGGSRIWDEARIHQAHMTRRGWDHRLDIAKRGRVHVTLAKLSPFHIADVKSVYVPFGASRTTWQAYCVFTKAKRCLLALALRTNAIRDAFARKQKVDVETLAAPFETLLTWVEDEVAKLEYGGKIRPGQALPTGHKLAPALAEADSRDGLAIGAYHDLRLARIGEERKPSRELLEAKRRERELKVTRSYNLRLYGDPDYGLVADRQRMG